MKLDDLESQGLIERVEPNLGNVKRALERAQRDLRTARATLDIDEEWAYTIACHAMLRAGRALRSFLNIDRREKISIRQWENFVLEFLERNIAL
jgi:hypothetical protein